jgi:hypothetical protein
MSSTTSSLGTEPVFSEDLTEPSYWEERMTAGRLGSPMTSTVWVGEPWEEVSYLLSKHRFKEDSPEKGFWRRMVNSPEGGGAIERGILICNVVGCWKKF